MDTISGEITIFAIINVLMALLQVQMPLQYSSDVSSLDLKFDNCEEYAS